MKIFTPWLRSYLPVLAVDDAQLAEDLTLRGLAVEGIFESSPGSANPEGSVFDMDITTNRVDAMNHFGIAREIAAIYGVALHPLDTTLPASEPADRPFSVKIEDEALCGRFTAQVLRGVSVGPSEGRVEHFFAALGQKRISNAVDATNFALLGMGQPTHAYDLDKLAGGITVRRARAGETIRLLDGSTRTLVPEDLVVADEVKALGLAGVMGGWDSMITPETRNILVEAAWFEPAAVRASSRRHLLHTDASHRFERGADFAAAPAANALVTKTILEACGGRLEGALVDVVVGAHRARTEAREPVELSVGEVRRHLGTTIDREGITPALVERYLTALGCRLQALGGDRYSVALPSWRLDLAREIDLIEEIARVYGYNRFANTLPAPGVTVAHPLARKHEAVRRMLLALGFTEALSSSFAGEEESRVFAPGRTAVAMANPLSDEAANLRPSLVPGMVGMLAHNLNRDVLDARLFETGAIFSTAASGEETIAAVEEVQALALGLTGRTSPSNLARPEDAAFYEVKGAVEALAGLFEVGLVSLSAEAPGFLEPGRAATLSAGGRTLASFGQLASAEAARRKLRQPVWLAAVDLALLFAHPLRATTAAELSRFQAVERDFSFVFPDAVTWAQVEAAVRQAVEAPDAPHAAGVLRSVRPVERWRDEKKFPGVYASLIRVVLQSQERTLDAAELTAWSEQVIRALTALGGQLRGE